MLERGAARERHTGVEIDRPRAAFGRVIKKLAAVLTPVAVVVLYLVAWPVPIEPVAWTPPLAPTLDGPWAPNTHLADVERFGLAFGVGPEDVAVDSLGRVYGGLRDGRIVRMAHDGSDAEVFADTGGRPLGLAFDQNGNLIVGDAFEGLLSISAAGDIEVLSTAAGGVPFALTDDVDIAPNGVVYFSDASSRYDQDHYIHDILESRPNGRLLAYDPGTAETRVVLEGLHFANGVAVSRDGLFVLVTETTRYRVVRHWLAGPRQGETELLIENLPGLPDGVSAGADGTFWLALVTRRNPILDQLAPRPFFRKVIARLPEVVRPKAERYAFVLGLDADGRVLHNLQDPSGVGFAHITSVEQVGSQLYLGSHEEAAWARIGVPD